MLSEQLRRQISRAAGLNAAGLVDRVTWTAIGAVGAAATVIGLSRVRDNLNAWLSGR